MPQDAWWRFWIGTADESDPRPLALETTTTSSEAESTTTSDAPSTSDTLEVDTPPSLPVVDNADLNEEWVRVRNDGENLVDLTGWGIKDESAAHRYEFPTGFVLTAGESVIVYSGCGDDFGTSLYWCNVASAIWNNEGDTAFLTDPSGNTHTSKTYVPATTTTQSTTTTAQPTTTSSDGGANCHPSYTGQCVPVGVSDVDCAGGTGDGPYYTGRVIVVGPDVYGLDHDSNGIGCENS